MMEKVFAGGVAVLGIAAMTALGTSVGANLDEQAHAQPIVGATSAAAVEAGHADNDGDAVPTEVGIAPSEMVGDGLAPGVTSTNVAGSTPAFTSLSELGNPDLGNPDLDVLDLGNAGSVHDARSSAEAADAEDASGDDGNWFRRLLGSKVPNTLLNWYQTPFEFVMDRIGGNALGRAVSYALMPLGAAAHHLYEWVNADGAEQSEEKPPSLVTSDQFAARDDATDEAAFDFPLDTDDYEGQPLPPVDEPNADPDANAPAPEPSPQVTPEPDAQFEEPDAQFDEPDAQFEQTATDDAKAEEPQDAQEEPAVDPESPEARFADALRKDEREGARDLLASVWEQAALQDQNAIDRSAERLVQALAASGDYEPNAAFGHWLREGLLLGYDPRFALAVYEQSLHLVTSSPGMSKEASDAMQTSAGNLEQDTASVWNALRDSKLIEGSLLELAACDGGGCDYERYVHDRLQAPTGTPRLRLSEGANAADIARNIKSAMQDSKTFADDPQFAATRAALDDVIESQPTAE